jgi:hypothetical protein
MTPSHSKSRHRVPARLLVFVTLYVLATPVYLVRFLVRSIRTLSRFRAIRSGVIACPHCGTANALDLLGTCRRCGVTEFGSRLHCSNCSQTNRGFACDGCSAFIRVL